MDECVVWTVWDTVLVIGAPVAVWLIMLTLMLLTMPPRR